MCRSIDLEAVRFAQGTQDKAKILVTSCVNRTESLARNRIFGKTWQDFSGVALRENSCKKNLVKIEQPLNLSRCSSWVTDLTSQKFLTLCTMKCLLSLQVILTILLFAHISTASRKAKTHAKGNQVSNRNETSGNATVGWEIAQKSGQSKPAQSQKSPASYAGDFLIHRILITIWS